MKSTKEIKLRAVEPEDVDFLYKSENDNASFIWTDYSAPISRHQLLQYTLGYQANPFEEGQLRLIVSTADKESIPIGIIDLYDISVRDRKAFVGIYILPEFRNENYAMKALQLLEEYAGKTLALNRMAAKISTQNTAAVNLFGKCGYEKLALLPSWYCLGGKYHDILLLSKNL